MPQARKKTKAGKTQSAAERKRKERIAKAKKICQVYACGIHTIASCCESEGVSYDIFYEWGEQYPEIRELYKNAKETHRKKRFDGLAEKALNSFERLIAGYDYEETHTEALPAADGKKMIVRLVRKVTKHVTPHPGMVAMAMKNWHGMKDVQQLEHSGEITTRQVMEIGGQRVEF